MGVRALSRSGVPNDRNPINFYADDGLVYKGLIPRRPDDKIGIAAMFAPRQQCAWARCRFCIFFGQSVVSGVQQRDRDRDGCIKRRSNRGGCCNRICNTSSIPAGASSILMAPSEETRWLSAFAHSSIVKRCTRFVESQQKQPTDIPRCLRWVIRDRCSRSCLPVHVRFGPKATYIRRCREMTRWARRRHRQPHR
jgi:hypothetical protein